MSNGLFTVTLDFGNQFPGANRWLEIGVRTNGSETFSVLSPRQPLTPTPYAIYASSSSAAGVSGTLPDAQLSSNVALRAGGNAFSGNQTIDGNFGVGTTTPQTTLDVRGPNPVITVGTGADGSGALHLGNSAHGVKRGYASSLANDVGLFTTSGDLYLAAAGETTNQFVLKNNGNVGIGISNPTNKLHVAGDMNVAGNNLFVRGPAYIESSGRLHVTARAGELLYLNPFTDSGDVHVGGGSGVKNLKVRGETTTTAVNITSDRNAKEQFKPVNAREVLDKVARLPITEWQYKSHGDARHIGPMAQDFHESFALGRDDKHITSVDADGVALAAIQGLNEKLEEQLQEKNSQIGRLQTENQSLAARLAAIEQALGLSKNAATTVK